MHYSESEGFTLSKQELRALCEFASPDPTRASMNQIYFEPSKGRIVATDGHCLVMVENASGAKPQPEFVVPLETLESFCKLLRQGQVLSANGATDKACRDVRLSVFQEQVPASARVQAVLNGSDPAEFPPYGHVIPLLDGMEPAAGAMAFNARYLSRLALVQRATGTECVRCYFPGQARGAAVFRTVAAPKQGGAGWTVVIMPAVNEFKCYEPEHDEVWSAFQETARKSRRPASVRRIA